MKKYLSWVLILFLIVFAFFLASGGRDGKEAPVITANMIKIGDAVLNIEVADTDAERRLGLSGRENLREGSALLFVFDEENYYGIWMKDMKFPIDIIWLDKDKKVVHVRQNVSPATFPEVFYSPAKSLFVLETHAGLTAQYKVQTGNFAEF